MKRVNGLPQCAAGTVFEISLQSNLGYPNVDYLKLMDFSKTTDGPDFFLLSIALRLSIFRILIFRKK